MAQQWQQTVQNESRGAAAALITAVGNMDESSRGTTIAAAARAAPELLQMVQASHQGLSRRLAIMYATTGDEESTRQAEASYPESSSWAAQTFPEVYKALEGLVPKQQQWQIATRILAQHLRDVNNRALRDDATTRCNEEQAITSAMLRQVRDRISAEAAKTIGAAWSSATELYTSTTTTPATAPAVPATPLLLIPGKSTLESEDVLKIEGIAGLIVGAIESRKESIREAPTMDQKEQLLVETITGPLVAADGRVIKKDGLRKSNVPMFMKTYPNHPAARSITAIIMSAAGITVGSDVMGCSVLGATLEAYERSIS